MEQNINIEPFLDSDGKIKQFPQKQRTKRAILAYLAERFERNRIYTEKEINLICENAHTFGDYFLLRRELVDHGFLCRTPDGSQYWSVPND